MSTDKALEEWANKVETALPMECPKCNKALNQIRYALDVNQTTIHLTRAVNQHHYFVAECPFCGHELKREGAGDRHIR